jgi:hypothetical protein
MRIRRDFVNSCHKPVLLYLDYASVGLILSKGALMRVQTGEAPPSVLAFAPKKERPDTTIVADDAGHGIIALLQKAAEMAKSDCDRAMDLAHRLSFELRAAEERARESEGEANHFRDRATRAEEWLNRIHSEVEQTFFQKNGRQRFA